MIPYTIGMQGITFFLKGRQRTIQNDHPRYSEIRASVIAGDEDALDSIVNVKALIVKATLGKVVVTGDDQVMFDGKLVPDYLANRIVSHYISDPELVEPLVAFAEKLMGNPNIDVRTDLYRWLEAGNMPIYPDGDFLAYKLVKSDFTPHHRGQYGHDQSPGKVVTQPRNTCNGNRNDTCASGLHFCSYSYLPTFDGWHRTGDNVVIQLKINPADVVAIPTDYNLSKGRTCRFEVIAQIDMATIAEDFGTKLVVDRIESAPERQVFHIEVDAEPEEVEVTIDAIAKDERLKLANEALAKHNGNKTKAAAYLGLARSTFYSWLKG